jgi:hypothetical protein
MGAGGMKLALRACPRRLGRPIYKEKKEREIR